MNEYVLTMLLTVITICQCVELRLEIRQISEHRSILITPIQLGTPMQRVNVVVDINSYYSWIKDAFKPSLSKSDVVLSYTARDMQQHVDNYYIQGYHLKDKVQIGEMIIQNFAFLFLFKSVEHSNANLKDVKGVLGLNCGDKIELKKLNENISFINRARNQFFKTRIIKLYLNHSLSDTSKQQKEILTIGQTEDDINNNYETCEYINNNNDDMSSSSQEEEEEEYFKCYMSHIYVGNVPNKNDNLPFTIKKNNSLKVNTFVYFSTINQLSFCNYEQFMFIVNTFFIKMINNNECYLKHLNNTNNTITIIMCDYIAISQMNKINFVFNTNNNVILSISANDFFIKASNGYQMFTIAHKDSIDKWVFGYELMKLLPIGFNHEDYTVRFYYHNNSNNVLHKVEDNSIDFSLSDIDISKLKYIKDNISNKNIINKSIIMICNILISFGALLLFKLRKTIGNV